MPSVADARNQELAITGSSARSGTVIDAAGVANDARHESRSGADAPGEPGLAARQVSAFDDFQFELVTAAFYHRSRVTWFAGLHRASMFVNILAGTAAVAFIKPDPTVSIVLALVLAIVSSANLAFDFAGLARKHEDARRTYHDLAADLELGKGDESAVKKLRARMIRAAADEPIVFEAAERVAFNAAIRSLGRHSGDEFILTRWQRFWRHAWPYSGTRFPQRKDA